MRDPWALRDRLFSLYYPVLMGASERSGQRTTRRRLLSQARGRTLEIGAGNGYNLPHYPDTVRELVLTEPSPHMRRQLRRALREPPRVGSWTVRDAGAERLPFPDAHFDTVVASYVHCTVPDPVRALDEIHRVLRPGGAYLFLEHIRAADGTTTGRMQDLLAPMNRCFGGGCHPNRRTDRWLRESRLDVEHLEHGTMPMAVPTVRPIVLGTARRPDAASASQ